MTSRGYVRIGLGITLGLFISLVCVVLIFDSAWFRQPPKETAGTDLFGRPDVLLNLECSHDMIGLTNHGEAFDFYEYNVSSSEKLTIIPIENLPNFTEAQYGQSTRPLQSIERSKWLPTPVRNEDKLHMNSTEFGNLQDFRCSKQFVESQYLHKTGNYYAYFSAYPVGSFVYVWVPTEQKLFLIRKRG
jgi:hypothetical protein